MTQCIKGEAGPRSERTEKAIDGAIDGIDTDESRRRMAAETQLVDRRAARIDLGKISLKSLKSDLDVGPNGRQ